GYRRAHPDAVEPVLYSFRAKDIFSKPETDFTSQGSYSADSVLNGTLEITGLDLSRHQALLPDSSMRLQKGMADISFHYQYARQPEAEAGPAEPVRQNKIFNGRFKATSFVLGRNNVKAAAGEMMVCSDFHFDALSKTIVCEQLELSNSEVFAAPLFGRQDPLAADAADSRRFIINNLQVNGSTVHATLQGDTGAGKSSDLVMRNVTLEGTNLQAEKGADNIKASAEIGKKARLSVNGSYSPLTGHGTLQVALQDMELALLHPYFSSWFVPRINTGLFSASGSVRLPDRVFQGNLRVDDLDAGEQGRGLITWQRAVSRDCTYRAQSMVLEMDELIIERPSVLPGLSNGERPVEKYILLQDDALPSSLRIDVVSVEDGVYGLSEPILFPGFQPLLQNINGTFSLADADRLHFLVNGNIGGEGGFRLQGTGSPQGVDSYDLQAWDFPLRPFDAILRKEAGFSGHGATASWTLEEVKGENGAKMAARIAVHGVVPESGGSAVSALALILDENHRLVMEMEDEYSSDQTQPFLLQRLINRLRHQEVKASISPLLALKSSLPSLDLPEWAPFAPGSAVVDESVALSDYQELLRMRPFISLRLQGQYDPVADERVLRAELQEEADRQREIENKRRALEKVKIRQREKKRLEDLKAGTPGVVAEEIPASELNGDMLQPLPRVLIELDPSMLEDLARQRSESLYAYFVNNLELDPARIILAPAVLKGGSGVSITVGPYMPPEKDEDDS
ncbi:MAG: DUF748 domain-containing protein, partial [Desulfobulbaceae bacterium]|nr:DUF748 domain-containing protein [Desulfobulbaceae bacterium]